MPHCTLAKRKFDPVATIHLFILQILNGNTAILHLRHLAGSAVNGGVLSGADASAAVGVPDVAGLQRGHRRAGRAPVFAAMRVLLVDATSSLTPTRSIRKLFKQPASINGLWLSDGQGAGAV